MKPFYVKAEGVSREKQQELLELAVDAGAVMREHRECTRHKQTPTFQMDNNWEFFGVNQYGQTYFEDDADDFGDNAVEMTCDEAWEYVTGIIRNSERSYTRDEMIEWLRENTTRENWENQDSTIVLPKPWRVTWNSTIMENVVDDIYSPGSDITKINVFPPASPAPAPATPRTPLFDRIEQALGSRNVEIAGEDHLVGQVKVDAHKARILDKVVEEFNVYPGQNIITTLKARLEVAKESPAPRSASPENIEKAFRNGYSGVHATPITESVGSPRTPLFDRIKQALGSDITDEDSLVDRIDDIATIANAAEHFVKSTHRVLGTDFNFEEMNKRFDLLLAVTDVEPKESLPPEQSPESPTVDRSKPRNKYDREIIPGVYVDVYDVLNAFETGGADIDHGVKKLLAPGGRGIKDEITDLEEAINSIQRRIDHIKEWSGHRG